MKICYLARYGKDNDVKIFADRDKANTYVRNDLIDTWNIYGFNLFESANGDPIEEYDHYGDVSVISADGEIWKWEVQEVEIVE